MRCGEAGAARLRRLLRPTAPDGLWQWGRQGAPTRRGGFRPRRATPLAPQAPGPLPSTPPRRQSVQLRDVAEGARGPAEEVDRAGVRKLRRPGALLEPVGSSDLFGAAG